MAELITLANLYNDPNLQEYYQLEDLTGKNGNTLTNNNTVAFSAAKFNNGADTGASNTNKSLSIASALGYAGGAYAISFWVKIITEPGVSANYFLAEVEDDGTDTILRVYYQNVAGTRQMIFGRFKVGVGEDSFTYASGNLGTSALYHVVVTYNGITVRGYVNNIDVGNVAASGSGVSAISDGFRIFTESTLTDFASAIIDDVALFNRNLTAADVNLIFNGPHVGSMLHMIQ